MQNGNFIGYHTTYSKPTIDSVYLQPNYTAAATPYTSGAFEIHGPLHRTLTWTTFSLKQHMGNMQY